MVTIYDVDTPALLDKAAEQLKSQKLVTPPDWSQFVKTGVHKERAPLDPNWWYIRSAAVLRKIYILGPIGVEKLRRKYGGRKNRGVKPERFYKGSGNIARKILQQLEKAQLIEQKKGSKGRTITSKGRSFMDQLAGEVRKAQA